MATYKRSNAWNNGGTFANTDLLWYAKGVYAMQALLLNNLNSWWSFAAMHGEYISDPQFPGWGHLPSPPATPTTPLPLQNIQDKYWNQCQHQSWYFLPWAPRLPDRPGGADPGGGSGRGRSVELGVALLELFWGE